MWSREILGADFYHIVQWFYIYSILGWLVESMYMSICNREITNRGFVHGPICPIYGVGALTVFFLLRPFQGKYIILYILGLVLATTIEYLTARVMIFFFGEVWWDYNEKPFNYKGILCLESSIAWGFYTIIFFGIGHVVISGFVDSYPVILGKIMVTLITVYYIIDFLLSILHSKEYRLTDAVSEIKNTFRIRRS